jgi:DNA mismatch repair protein MutL
MPISALPESSIQLLRSPLAVSTPVTLVKELLDNAIDAKATSVEILISPNVVDKIEVRDNGLGIHPLDYNSLAKHGHTSKLRNFDELRTLAGKTLGFRGEALASVNALAKVTITTRTSTDPLATILRIEPKDGGVLDQQPGSAPVGTTVCVTDLYQALPVRKQVVTRESSKLFETVKDLLQSYAMARPQLRLRFKVLETPRLGWSYAPKGETDVSETLLQLFGTEAALGCFHRTGNGVGLIPGDGIVHVSDEATTKRFAFDALLMRQSVDSHLPKQRYISIDHRPVLKFKGITKKLVSVYGKYVNSLRTKSVIPLGDLFIRLNIDCPVGSYDTNIEPAKDDVLFEDETALLEQFERFCEEVYGSLKTQPDTRTAHPSQDLLQAVAFDASQQTRTFRALNTSGEAAERGEHTRSPESDNSSDPSKQISRSSMSIQPHSVSMPITEVSDERSLGFQVSSRRRPSTPAPTAWTAINAPSCEIRETDDYQESDVRYQGEQFRDFQLNSDMSNDLSEYTGNFNGRRNQGKKFQSRTQQRGAQRDSGTSPACGVSPWSIAQMHHDRRQVASPSHEEPEGQALVPNNAQCRPATTPTHEVLRHPGAPPRDLDVPPSLRYPNNSHEVQLPSLVLGGSYQIPLSTPKRLAQHEPLRLRHGNASTLRRAQPVRTPPSSRHEYEEGLEDSQTAMDGLKQTTLCFGKPPPVQLGQEVLERPKERQLHQVFVSAKRILSQQNERATTYQNALQSPVNESNNSSQRFDFLGPEPFIQLHSTNLQPVAQPMENAEPAQTSIPTGDPRAYLLRRQKSLAAEEDLGRPRKFRRLKSAFMPLENVPATDQTHSVIATATIDTQVLSRLVRNVGRYDKYVVDGDLESGLDMTVNEVRQVEDRLNLLLAH